MGFKVHYLLLRLRLCCCTNRRQFSFLTPSLLPSYLLVRINWKTSSTLSLSLSSQLFFLVPLGAFGDHQSGGFHDNRLHFTPIFTSDIADGIAHKWYLLYRASLKGMNAFKFGGVVQPERGLLKDRIIGRSRKIQAQFSQPRTRLLVKLSTDLCRKKDCFAKH